MTDDPAAVKMDRRQLLKNIAIGATSVSLPARAAGRSLRGTAINHISCQRAEIAPNILVGESAGKLAHARGSEGHGFDRRPEPSRDREEAVRAVFHTGSYGSASIRPPRCDRKGVRLFADPQNP
jgi:hypothetical protein